MSNRESVLVPSCLNTCGEGLIFWQNRLWKPQVCWHWYSMIVLESQWRFIFNIYSKFSHKVNIKYFYHAGFPRFEAKTKNIYNAIHTICIKTSCHFYYNLQNHKNNNMIHYPTHKHWAICSNHELTQAYIPLTWNNYSWYLTRTRA